jgi:hypothetical protein
MNSTSRRGEKTTSDPRSQADISTGVKITVDTLAGYGRESADMFEINAKVLCIDDRFPVGINDIFNALPRKGSIYTVRDIVPAQDWKMRGTCAVLLRELENRPNRHGIEPGFQCGRFREPTAEELENVATESLANIK